MQKISNSPQPRNTGNCAATGAPQKDRIMAISAPGKNQMATRSAVAASNTIEAISTAIHRIQRYSIETLLNSLLSTV